MMSKFLRTEIFYNRFLIRRLRFLFLVPNLTVCFVSVPFFESVNKIGSEFLGEYNGIFSYNKFVSKSDYFFFYTYLSDFYEMFKGSVGVISSLQALSLFFFVGFLNASFFMSERNEKAFAVDIALKSNILKATEQGDARPLVTLLGVKYLLFFISPRYCKFLCRLYSDGLVDVYKYGFVFFLCIFFRIVFLIFCRNGHNKSTC